MNHKFFKSIVSCISMDKSHHLILVSSLLLCSTISALFMIMRIEIPGSSLFLRILFFPFECIVLLSKTLVSHGGILLSSPVLYLMGVSISAAFLILLLYFFPKKMIYIGLGLFFFIFLVLVGKSAYIGIFYIFQETITAKFQSLRTFLEFSIALFILYGVLGTGILPTEEKGRSLNKE